MDRDTKFAEFMEKRICKFGDNQEPEVVKQTMQHLSRASILTQTRELALFMTLLKMSYDPFTVVIGG